YGDPGNVARELADVLQPESALGATAERGNTPPGHSRFERDARLAVQRRQIGVDGRPASEPSRVQLQNASGAPLPSGAEFLFVLAGLEVEPAVVRTNLEVVRREGAVLLVDRSLDP